MHDLRWRATPIDWEALKKRLARAGELLDARARPSPADARAALADRARALAARRVEPDSARRLDVVVFVLGGERYGLETRVVRTVIRAPRLVRLPGAPAFVAGATNLRGEVIDVLDVRTFLGAVVAPPGPTTRLVVLGLDRVEFAVVADDVLGVAPVDPAALRPPPEAPARLRPEYVRGVAPDGLALLDGAFLLRDPRLAVDGASPSPEVP